MNIYRVCYLVSRKISCITLWVALSLFVFPFVLIADQFKSTDTIDTHTSPNRATGTTECAGTFLRSSVSPYQYNKYILDKEYHLEKLEVLATGKGFKVSYNDNFGYVDNWHVDDFNKSFKLGIPLKGNVHIKQGQIDVEVDSMGIVKISGPRIIVEKISADESYEITLQYEPDYYLRQSIHVVQNGSCTFPSSYIKSQFKSMLQQLDIESSWVDDAIIEINGLLHLD